MALTDDPVLGRLGPFVELLRTRLAPGCDPGCVQASLAAVVAGCDGEPRSRDGRRASVLTPSGWPVEVSVSTSADGLRFVGEPGSRSPFFGPRLAAQRRAIDAVAGGATADDLRALADVLFPEPAAVPARTRFGTFVGVAHALGTSGRPTAVKVYGNVRAHDRQATSARLARRWTAFGALFDLVSGLPGLVPTFVALEADADRLLAHKLYVACRPDLDGELGGLARRLGADTGPLVDVLAAERVELGASTRPVVLALSDRWSRGTDLAVHLSARALGVGTERMAALARRMADAHGCAAGPIDALTSVVSSSAHTEAPWELTVLGVGLAADSSPPKVNAYAAPSRYSNSG